LSPHLSDLRVLGISQVPVHYQAAHSQLISVYTVARRLTPAVNVSADLVALTGSFFLGTAFADSAL
jgi:hypothetical protein